MGAVALAIAFMAGAGAAQAFSAHGSVEQVYVTGLAPGAQMSLLNRARPDGRHEASRRAGRPSVSQRRRREPATASARRGRGEVGAADGALDPAGAAEHEDLQPDDPLQRLRLPDHPRRHQAGDRRASAAGRDERRCRASIRPRGPGRSHADPDRVLGLRVRRPGRPAERDRDPRQPHGVHGGRRQHARHRLLGRRVRLLRAAPEPRRVRRDRDDRPPALGPASQGRDDGHLLRRDQPALHRADQSAEPGRDLAALGDRRHADDPLSGRHPEHGVRGRLGQGASPRRQAGRPQRRAALGLPADPGRRPDLQGATRRCTARRRTCWPRSGPTTTTCRRWPTRWRRSRSSTRSRCRSTWPASGRTSRRAVTARLWPSTSPAPSASGSRSRTAPTSTRSIRRPSTAGTTS